MPFCEAGYCSTNVVLLANELLKQGITKEEIRFILIRPQNRNDNVYPQADISNTESWSFHAVLQVGKFIFDLDHRNYSTPIRIDQYIQEMFGRNNLDFKTIDIMAFPFEKYMETFSQHKSLAYVYNLNLDTAPPIPLAKYLVDQGFKPTEIQSDVREPKDHSLISRTEYGISINHDKFTDFKNGQAIKFNILTPSKSEENSISGTLESLHSRFVRIKKQNGTLVDVPLIIVYTDSIKRIN